MRRKSESKDVLGGQAPFLPCEFGPYRLTERLAVGGMAEIFKARRSADDAPEPLVIKRILPQLLDDENFVEMFVDEAELMSRLRHPKVVRVLDFGFVEGHYYMALEYVNGVDGLALLKRCAQRRCRPTTGIVLHLVAEILDALDYAHNLTDSDGRRLGIVHRDISPSNVFVSWQGEVKLGDFGIAGAAFRSGRAYSSDVRGKYGYMAPEQVAGQTTDHRADIFAVGVILAELLMIRRLFYAESDLDVLLQVRDVQLSRLDEFGSRIAPDLRAILDTALAREPDLRYQTANIFRDALHRYLLQHGRMVRRADISRFIHRLLGHDAPLELGRVDASDLAVEPSSLPRPGPPATAEVAREGTYYRRRPQRATRISAQRRARPSYSDASSSDPGSGPIGRDLVTRVPRLTPIDDSLAIAPELPNSPSGGDFSGVTPARQVRKSDLVRAKKANRTRPHASPRVDRSPPGDKPTLSGELSHRSLFNIAFELALSERTGLLLVDTSTATKEIYLVDGDPQYVTSNDSEELFGRYLVRRGLLQDGELSMALAMLPRFDGKLGDALVSLGLLKPVEVLRHLTAQVRAKLLDAFAWEQGYFRFYANRLCARDSAPLGLDAFEVMGAAAAELAGPALQHRISGLLPRKLRAVSPAPVPPEVFRLGARPRAAYDSFDGRRSLAEVLRRFDDESERLGFMQVVFLMTETGLLR